MPACWTLESTWMAALLLQSTTVTRVAKQLASTTIADGELAFLFIYWNLILWSLTAYLLKTCAVTDPLPQLECICRAKVILVVDIGTRILYTSRHCEHKPLHLLWFNGGAGDIVTL
jgi:hypothetical protein